MKRVIIFFAFIILASLSFSQNLQLHYDFTDANSKNAIGRDYMTATFEMFKPDSMGATFWFIDLDFNGPHYEPNLAYLEIARDFKIWDFPLAVHGEYNGGYYYNGRDQFGGHFSNILIFGPSAAFELGKFSIGTYAGYRFDDYSRQGHDLQWTATWFAMFWKDRITLSGFLDIWSQDDFDGEGKLAVIMTEPQVWYNFTKAFALGGEIELSHNFVYGSKKLEAFPTLGLKIQF